jgi:hypothetical protein
MPLHDIEPYTSEFIEFAKEHPEREFNIVAIGCGLAGYKLEQIAPMFNDVPENCNLPSEFVKALVLSSHQSKQPVQELSTREPERDINVEPDI